MNLCAAQSRYCASTTRKVRRLPKAAAATLGQALPAAPTTQPGTRPWEKYINDPNNSIDAAISEAARRSDLPLNPELYPAPFTQLRWRREPQYYHHALYLEKGWLLEVVRLKGHTNLGKVVLRRILVDDWGFETLRTLPPRQHEQARDRVAEVMEKYGEQMEYNVFSLNCEHIVMLIMTGKACSKQVDTGMDALGAFLGLGAVAGVASAFAAPIVLGVGALAAVGAGVAVGGATIVSLAAAVLPTATKKDRRRDNRRQRRLMQAAMEYIAIPPQLRAEHHPLGSLAGRSQEG